MTFHFTRFLGPLALLFLPLFLHADCGPYNISAVPDKPFVAEVTTTDWHIVPGGPATQVATGQTSAIEVHIARDDSGRISVQTHIHESAAVPEQWTSYICDPGAGTITTLSTSSSPGASENPANLQWTGVVRQTPTGLVEPQLSCPSFAPPAQDLGVRSIQGNQVHGCRAAVVDNGVPVPGQFVDRWWSADLQSDLAGATINQTAGTEQRWVVTNLQPSEPDPSVFQMPAHLKILSSPGDSAQNGL